MLIRKFTLPLALAAFLTVGTFAGAQTTVSATTTGTTSAGLVTEISPEALVIRSESSTVPLRYTSSVTTSFVDETGRPVARELVTSGLPVTVQYYRDGDRMIAERVVVHREAAATTTTTTTAAPTTIEKTTTITRPPVVVEKPVVVEEPVVVEKKVPVVVERKVPVIVEKKVPVEKPVIVEKRVPAPVIEKKRTTTTTTTTTNDREKKHDD
jgi:hypothetical protein